MQRAASRKTGPFAENDAFGAYHWGCDASCSSPWFANMKPSVTGLVRAQRCSRLDPASRH